MKTPEGIRRLSLVVGSVLAAWWGIWYVLEQSYFGWTTTDSWTVLMIAGVGWFGGILLVRGVARIGIWMVKGFRYK